MSRKPFISSSQDKNFPRLRIKKLAFQLDGYQAKVVIWNWKERTIFSLKCLNYLYNIYRNPQKKSPRLNLIRVNTSKSCIFLFKPSLSSIIDVSGITEFKQFAGIPNWKCFKPMIVILCESIQTAEWRIFENRHLITWINLSQFRKSLGV